MYYIVSLQVPTIYYVALTTIYLKNKYYVLIVFILYCKTLLLLLKWGSKATQLTLVSHITVTTRRFSKLAYLAN